MIIELEVAEDIVNALTGYQNDLYRVRGFNASVEEIIQQSLAILVQNLEDREPEEFPIIVGENVRAKRDDGRMDAKALASALEPDS